MMEMAGIGMLPPEAGIAFIRRDLTAGGTRGEVVVAEALGILLEEWDETGGLDVNALQGTGLMTARVDGMPLHGGLTVETTLDPKEQPFLFDHQIDGTPVLPGVMGIEAFGEVARLLYPGWEVQAVENVDFLAPFKFYRNEARDVKVQAQFTREGGQLWAHCRLIGSRTLPKQDDPQITTHFTARVRLADQLAAAEAVQLPSAEQRPTVVNDDIYKVYFHGPAYQVIERAWRHGEAVAGAMPEALPANHKPEELPTVMQPRLIEACFQTAGLFEIGTTGKMGLPLHVDGVSALRALEGVQGRLHAVVRPDAERGSFDASVVDEAGTVYVTLRGYRTVALPGGVAEDKRKPLQMAMD
jgi:hypothetical protein